nr:transposase [Candidatus Freyarchaeota archaeon]
MVVCRTPVSYKYALRLLDVRRFTLHSFGGTTLILLVSAPIPSVEEVCAAVEEIVLERLILEEEREQRSGHLPERRRPWSRTRTKAPLLDCVGREARRQNLKKRLEIVTAVVETLGEPWNPSGRGRKPKYSPKKLAAAVLVKETSNTSFERLAAELGDVGYDARTEEAKAKGEDSKTPCPSHLHWVMTKIPEDYLAKALELLDQMVAEEHARLFGEERPEEYSIDSTEDTCTTLEEARVAMRTVLQHQTVRYNILTRLVTNTVRAAEAPPSRNTRDVRPLLNRVPPGAVVYMDREYDVEYNYEEGSKRGITLIVRQKLYRGKPYKGRFRREAQRAFDKGRYRRRKLVERPIGNRKTRDGGKLKYRRPDMRRKGLLLKYIAHNIHGWFMQLAWSRALQPVQAP